LGFAQTLHSPLKGLVGARAIRFELEGFLDIFQAGAGTSYRGENQPGIFHLRRDGGGLFRPTTRFAAIIIPKGFTRLIYR
jgi:hypothetical protein